MPWKMPPIRIGDTVYWYMGGYRNANSIYSARVLAVNSTSLHLKVEGIDRDFRVECSRNVDDPAIRDTERHEYGAWEVREELPVQKKAA